MRKLLVWLRPFIAAVAILAGILAIFIAAAPSIGKTLSKREETINTDEASQGRTSITETGEDKYRIFSEKICSLIKEGSTNELLALLDEEALFKRTNKKIDPVLFKKDFSSWRKEILKKNLSVEKTVVYGKGNLQGSADAISKVICEPESEGEEYEEFIIHMYTHEDGIRFFFSQMEDGKLGAR